MARPTYPATLLAKHQLSQNTVQLDFRVEGDFQFIAGQFIQFLIDLDGKQHKRSYSIANSPEAFQQSGHLEIAISFVDDGLASNLFAQAEPGLKLDISGPFGILTAPESHSGKLVLAGTGTGLAPYRAMIPNLRELAQQGTEIVVIMGVRSRADLIYETEFRQFADNSESIEYRVCFSREEALNEQHGEFSGYVQQQFASLDLNTDTDLIYLCGNPSMIDDAANTLKEMGFGPRQVKREKYVYSGH